MEDFDEDLLCEIFGVGTPPGEPIAHAINLAGVGTEQFLPSGVFACQAALDKVQVVVHAGVRSSASSTRDDAFSRTRIPGQPRDDGRTHCILAETEKGNEE